MLTKLRQFLRTYPYTILTFYPLVHIILFFILGHYETERYLVESSLDAYIPFCEWFVIPYYIWYAYLFGGMIAFCLVSRKDFLRMAIFTIGGMAFCMFFCAVFPTAIDFRPTSFDRSNPAIWLVEFTYAADHPWNVFPSMHCFGAIGITIAVWKSPLLCRWRWSRPLSAILCVLICASTMLIKQHSILDLFGAIVLSAILYPIAYCVNWKFFRGKDAAEPLRALFTAKKDRKTHLPTVSSEEEQS